MVSGSAGGVSPLSREESFDLLRRLRDSWPLGRVLSWSLRMRRQLHVIYALKCVSLECIALSPLSLLGGTSPGREDSE